MNILTAEEFLHSQYFSATPDLDFEEVKKQMIEFAKLHVEAALKRVNKKARIKLHDGSLVIVFGNNRGVHCEIDKHILIPSINHLIKTMLTNRFRLLSNRTRITIEE